MKLNNIFIKAMVLVMSAFTITACSDWLDINTDPNNAQPEDVTADQLLPAIHLSMGTHFGGRSAAGGSINELPSILVQHYYTLGLSRYSLDGASVNSVFRDLYADALRDIELLIQLSEEQNLPVHSGIAKLCKAYIYSVLVDQFGDVPFSEASQGLENLDPVFDDAQTIYNALFPLIDEGIAEVLTTEDVLTPNAAVDLFYGADVEQWQRFGNSLKLKLYNQIRLVDPTGATNGISQILNNPTEFPIIDTRADNFQFTYFNSDAPEGRHPLFMDNYIAGQTQYMSNYLIDKMLSTNDPRVNYYIYRQTLDDPEGTDVPCDAIPCFYGYQGSGYWGRDHGDPSGIPNDQGSRATFGVYPAGGYFDTGSSNLDVTSANQPFVATGAGIAPILTDWLVLFTQAEAALTLGTPGDPQALFQAAMEAQFDHVFVVGATLDARAPAPGDAALVAARDAYIANVIADYTAAASDDERLQVMMTEKHTATFGNGMEAYNDFRRTGFPLFVDQQLQDGTTVAYPSNQGSISPLGPFPRLLPYANRELQTNLNAPAQRLVSEPVFWDNN